MVVVVGGGWWQILNPVLTANEVVENYHAKRKKLWILKIDLQKAFDRVNLGFLEKILYNKNFDPKWTSLILGCLKKTKFSVFIAVNHVIVYQHREALDKGIPNRPSCFF